MAGDEGRCPSGRPARHISQGVQKKPASGGVGCAGRKLNSVQPDRVCFRGGTAADFGGGTRGRGCPSRPPETTFPGSAPPDEAHGRAGRVRGSGGTGPRGPLPPAGVRGKSGAAAEGGGQTSRRRPPESLPSETDPGRWDFGDPGQDPGCPGWREAAWIQPSAGDGTRKGTESLARGRSGG